MFSNTQSVFSVATIYRHTSLPVDKAAYIYLRSSLLFSALLLLTFINIFNVIIVYELFRAIDAVKMFFLACRCQVTFKTKLRIIYLATAKGTIAARKGSVLKSFLHDTHCRRNTLSARYTLAQNTDKILCFVL